MGKKFYGILIGIFIIISIVLGVFSYSEAQKISMLRKEVAEFPWVVPMDEGYIDFYGGNESKSFVGVNKNQGHVVLNQEGGVVASEIAVNFGNDYYSYTEKNKQGIKNSTGQIIISPKFYAISSFDGEYGVGEGESMDEYFIFDHVGAVIHHSANPISQLNGPYFMIEGQDVKQIINIDKDKGVFNGRSFRYVDRLFSQGLCYVEEIISDEKIVKGYIDKSGEMIIKTEDSLMGFGFSEGKAFVYEKDKIRCIDTKGNTLFVIPMKVDDGQAYNSYFHNGVAVIGDYEMRGLINEKGRWIIEPSKYSLDFIARNLLKVGYGSKVGVVRIGGEGNAD